MRKASKTTTTRKKAAKTTTAQEEAVKNIAALDEIDKIRRNGFNPGDEAVDDMIQQFGPQRTLVLLRACVRIERLLFEPYH